MGLAALTGCPSAGMAPPAADVPTSGAAVAGAPGAGAAGTGATVIAPPGQQAGAPAVSRYFTFSGIVAIAQQPVPGAALRVLDAATGEPLPIATSFPAAVADPMGVVSQSASTGTDGRYDLVITNPRPGAVLTLEASDGTRSVSNIVVLPAGADPTRYHLMQIAGQGEALGAQKKPSVSTDDMIAKGEVIQRRSSQLAERLSKMLDEARREKDIMRANCVNRKLTEVNANTRNVEQRLRALRDAAAAGDEARVSHENTVLSVLSQKLEQLDQEATQCLGQPVNKPGASQIFTNIAGDNDDKKDPIAGPPPPSATTLFVPITEVTTALTIVANQVVALAKTGRLDPTQFSNVLKGLIADLNPAMQKVQSAINANPDLSNALTTGTPPNASSPDKTALNTALAGVTDTLTKGVSNAVQTVVTQTDDQDVLKALAGQTFTGTDLKITIDPTGKTVSLTDTRTGQIITVDTTTGQTTTTGGSQGGDSVTSNFNPTLDTLRYSLSAGELTLVASQPSGPAEIDVATVAARMAASDVTLDTGHATSTYNTAGFPNPIATAPSTARINVPSENVLVNLGITTATADAQAATSLTLPADFGGVTLATPDYASYMVITEYALKIARFQIYKDRPFDNGTWHLVALSYNLNDSMRTHHGNTTTLTTKAVSDVASDATADVVFVSRLGQVKKQLAMPITIVP